MSPNRRRPVRALAVAMGLVLACGAATPITAADAPACPVEAGGADVAVVPGEVPVLMVHGILSEPDMWEQPLLDRSESLFDLVADIDGAEPYAFDYREAALEWVTDDKIGPALADTIDCLARESGRQVVVVAHSMGGLATQFALARNGGSTARNVADVVTLGTPFQGSLALSVSQAALIGVDIVAVVGGNPQLAVGMETVLALCAKAGRDGLASDGINPCGLAAVPRSPVGASLQLRSSDIKALPRWPTEPRLQSLAGSIDLIVDLPIGSGWPPADVRVGQVGIGDGPVGLDSATAAGLAGEPVRCDEAPSGVLASPCWHGNLHRNPVLVGTVLTTVASSVQAQTPAPVTEIDWNDRQYTTDCAGIAAESFPVEVVAGRGSTPEGSVEGYDSYYEVVVADVVLDDLTGDTRPEAAVLLYCKPQPTSPNLFGTEVQVFTEGEVQLGAALRAQDAVPASNPVDSHLADTSLAVTNGELTAQGVFRVDGQCRACEPTEESLTWTWDGRQFVLS